jgi:hypothetical protein
LTSKEIEDELRSVSLHLTTLDKILIAHIIIASFISLLFLEYLTTGYIDNIPKSLINQVVFCLLNIIVALAYYLAFKKKFKGVS